MNNFKDFVSEDDRAKVQRYINNNIKLNYFDVLGQNSSVLNKYLNHAKSNLGIEEKELFRCPCPVRRKAEKKFDQKIRFPSAETPGFLLSE